MDAGSNLEALDTDLVAAAKSIKILTALAWPEGIRDTFLEAWRRGEPQLPAAPPSEVDFGDERAALQTVRKRIGVAGDDPVAHTGDPEAAARDFLARTAQSYLQAIGLLEAQGTPRFTELSREIYGAPTDPTAAGASNLAMAERILQRTEAARGTCDAGNASYCLLAEEVAERIRQAVVLIPGFSAEVIVDDHLTAKAAAGNNGVRLRGSTCFSEADVAQLTQHELFVHTLTARNGRAQPILKSLGLGAPRTTQTQEGLAVFAEVVTASIDISRLRRLALRVVATDMALNGADFVELFEYFLAAGQVELESFQSASRIFRGGDPRGSIVYTKDGCYLAGLAGVHQFLRAALEGGRLDDILRLFAGRLTLDDVALLAPCFDEGWIVPPQHLPAWAQHRGELMAFLIYGDAFFRAPS